MDNLAIKEENKLIEQKNDKNFTLIEVDSKKYALKTKAVQEIVKIIEFDYPLEMPTCVLGLIKHEEKPISVIDLRELFKKERIVYDTNAKIIVAKTQNATLAFLCDKVIDIKKLNATNIHNLPFQKENDFYDGIFIENEENIYILNVENIQKYLENYKGEIQDEKTAKNFIKTDEQTTLILKERKTLLYQYNNDLAQIDTPLYDRGVSFSINDVKYYINLASIKEFHRLNDQKFIKVPNCPEYIMGLINIKGDYICILDIRSLYGATKTQIKEKSTLIILNSEEFKIGILADEICENMNIDFEEIIQNKIQKQEDDKMLEFVKNDEIYQIIDTEKLLNDKRLTIC
ncbi:MAG: chemotaxis protein CheW [Candidatus Gastranaerophilales bacterium]|nr:chemotaxis protein CheW [Candidatus Gastranaerophilales bacterium]